MDLLVPCVASALGLGVASAAVPGVVNAEERRRGLPGGLRPILLLQPGCCSAARRQPTVGNCLAGTDSAAEPQTRPPPGSRRPSRKEGGPGIGTPAPTWLFGGW